MLNSDIHNSGTFCIYCIFTLNPKYKDIVIMRFIISAIINVSFSKQAHNQRKKWELLIMHSVLCLHQTRGLMKCDLHKGTGFGTESEVYLCRVRIKLLIYVCIYQNGVDHQTVILYTCTCSWTKWNLMVHKLQMCS